MLFHIFVIVSCSTAILLFDGLGSAADAPLDEREILDALQSVDSKDGLTKLVRMGSSAFPVYQGILEDRRCTLQERRGIYVVLSRVKSDRAHFVETVVADLAHKDGELRTRALDLLAEIGTFKDTAPIVSLLSDADTVDAHTVPYSAAKTLAAIGGSRDVVAMDAWLLGGSHPNNKKLREHVKKCRDELAARLAKEPKK